MLNVLYMYIEGRFFSYIYIAMFEKKQREPKNTVAAIVVNSPIYSR